MNWRPYLIPALVFQSVIIGGGYATGRELVQFFMPSGPMGGILGLTTAGLVFAIVMGCAYEFARVTGSYDYRSFCKALLGPGWIVFEIAYVSSTVLVLAVVGAAAGELVHDVLTWPPWVGSFGMIALVGVLTFYGSTIIASVLSLWSLLLYGAYALLFVLIFQEYRYTIDHALSVGPINDGWALAGLRYASYNMAIPGVLFCVALISTRRQSITAGVLTGVIAVLPAMAFFVAMLAFYPEIENAPVPALVLMGALEVPLIKGLFYLVVFGTFVETGTGLLHSINERVDRQLAEHGRHISRRARAAIALALLLGSIYGATQIGIIDLIDRGYGFISWVFIIVLLLPLLTVGLMRIRKADEPPGAN